LEATYFCVVLIQKTEKMKQIGLATVGSVLLSVGVMAEGSENDIVTYEVISERSNVVWTGKKVTGKHYGNVSIKNGEIVVQEGSVSHAELVLDMNTITNTDLTDKQWNKKLVDHLKSDDFFSVEKHPHVTFVLTDFSLAEDNDGNDQKYIIAGDLTIKGIKHQISFPAAIEVNNSMLTAKGSVKIDRTKYDIRYGSGSFFKGLGDNMIYNDFEIEFELVAEISDSKLEVVEQ
jgi:polyisoprenoid-binding protein YceI